MKTRSLFVAGAMLMLACGARAQVFQASPFFGYRFGGGFETSSGGSVGLKAGECFGLMLEGGPRDSELQFDLLWSRQNSGVDLSNVGGPNSMDVIVDQFGFGCSYEAKQSRLRENFSLLLGATVFEPDNADTQVYFCFTAGIGVKYFLLKNLALRADLRGYCTVVESDSSFISNGSTTLVHFSGSTLLQGEISGGITLAF